MYMNVWVCFHVGALVCTGTCVCLVCGGQKSTPEVMPQELSTGVSP